MVFILIRLLKWLVISVLLLMGIVGVILPILNGTFFLLLALILLSFESLYIKKNLHALTSKNAKVHTWHLYIENKLKKFLKIQ